MIANSLSITIAQRTREFATLRTIGASRRQVLRSVILEALVIGLVASVVGLFLGLALGKGLFKLFDVVGFTLPNNGLTFQTRTIVVSLAVGVLVTLVASLRPAFRATRVPPIAAVREGATLPVGRFHRYRGIAAAATALVGFAALLYGLFGSGLGTTQVLLWMGVGAFLIFVGVALFSSHLVVPMARILGWPATRIGGAAGSLGTRQHPAQPAAHGLDRFRPHDRPRAGHARRDPGRRHHRHVQQRRGRPRAWRVLRDHGAEQLLSDSGQRGDRRGEDPRARVDCERARR